MRKHEKHHGGCVVKQVAVYDCRKQSLASHSHNTSRKGNSTSVGDTLKFRGRQGRSTHYGGLQYDADWLEVLSEGVSDSQ